MDRYLFECFMKLNNINILAIDDYYNVIQNNYDIEDYFECGLPQQIINKHSLFKSMKLKYSCNNNSKLDLMTVLFNDYSIIEKILARIIGHIYQMDYNEEEERIRVEKEEWKRIRKYHENNIEKRIREERREELRYEKIERKKLERLNRDIIINLIILFKKFDSEKIKYSKIMFERFYKLCPNTEFRYDFENINTNIIVNNVIFEDLLLTYYYFDKEVIINLWNKYCHDSSQTKMIECIENVFDKNTYIKELFH